MSKKYNPDCPICNGTMEENGLYTKICTLGVSSVYLFKEQTYFGRSVVALNQHEQELYLMDQNLRHQFIDEVVLTAQALQLACGAQKINYGAFGDKMPHVHFHLVPKYEGGEDWGGLFKAHGEEERFLSEEQKQNLMDSIRDELTKLMGKA